MSNSSITSLCFVIIFCIGIYSIFKISNNYFTKHYIRKIILQSAINAIKRIYGYTDITTTNIFTNETYSKLLEGLLEKQLKDMMDNASVPMTRDMLQQYKKQTLEIVRLININRHS